MAEITLPAEFIEYVETHGAFEGFTRGEEMPGYVALWRADEVTTYNADYEINEYAPGFLGFGTNGGGEALVFNANGEVFMLPLIGMEPQYALKIANSFKELEQRFEHAV